MASGGLGTSPVVTRITCAAKCPLPAPNGYSKPSCFAVGPGRHRAVRPGSAGATHVVLFVVQTWPETDPMTGEKSAVPSAPGRQSLMRGRRMKKGTSGPLTLAQKAELAALAAWPDDKINTRALPEQWDWSGARRGVFYRPTRQQLTLRLDADLIVWSKKPHPQRRGLPDQHQHRVAGLRGTASAGLDCRLAGEIPTTARYMPTT